MNGQASQVSRRNFLATLAAGLGMAACQRQRGIVADPAWLGIGDAADALRTGRLSAVELVEAYLGRIERYDADLRSYVTVLADSARASARDAEHEIRAGRWRGPLHGIPIAIKDNIDVAGVPTTAASAALDDRLPPRDAPVARLREAGAIILGKLNMHELALGTTSTVSAAGVVRNPWHRDYIAGGSSGGCGAAVAAALCAAAVGTDTGGSVRIPASCCGIVGLKPTFGLVESDGIVYISPSYDHVGPMARTVEDTALLLDAMTSVPLSTRQGAWPGVHGVRVGVLDTGDKLLCDTLPEEEVERAVAAALLVLETLGATVRPARLALHDHSDVLRLEAVLEHEERFARAGAKYQPATREVILADGEGLTSAIAAERLPAQLEALGRYREAAASWFRDVDVLVAPTLATLPLRVDAVTHSFATQACTFAFNESGLPSLSVPCGFSESGLPIGLLISGPPGGEARVLSVAQAYEAATSWHLRRPPLDAHVMFRHIASGRDE